MELFFNELSNIPLSVDKYAADEIMIKFAKAIGKARQIGFRNIRSYLATNQIELANNYSLHNWMFDREMSEIERNLLMGMITQPFIKDEDEEIIDEYLGKEFYFVNEEHGIDKTECTGLAAAHLYDMPSVSISSQPIWDEIKLPIVVENKDTSSIEEVFNISSIESFDDNTLAQHIENLGTLILKETDILPTNKKKHLAQHHGKSELTELCNRIKHSPYVIEMRSTDWGGKSFIRKTHADGVIEIVLHKTQREYALWVQTTGKNLRETNAIAEILEKKYS
jgi:hypothetical protein